MTNRNVARAWAQGSKATSHTGSFSTNGRHLYSYRLLIGTTIHGRKVVYDYRAPDDFRSQTTSCHVGLAAQYADDVKTPVFDAELLAGPHEE